jgi:hypothetical protein
MEVDAFMTWFGVIILMAMIWIVLEACACVATGASRSGSFANWRGYWLCA